MSCVAQKGQDREPVEVRDPGKVIRGEFLPRIKTTASCQHVVGAVFHEPAETFTNGILAKFLQPRSLDLIGEAIHSVVEIFLCLCPCQGHEHGWKGSLRVCFKSIGVCQVIGHFRPDPGFHLPDIRRLSPAYHVCVGNIKHIPQAFPGAAVVDQGDTL